MDSSERLSKPAKNHLIQQGSSLSTSSQGYQPKKIRWKRLGSLTAANMDILKEQVDQPVPDVTSRSTLLSLAMMTNNAYSGIDNTTDWYDLGEPWHLVSKGAADKGDELNMTTFVVVEYLVWVGL
jgi:putative lipase involved disintegration of autophagic bodies